MDFKALSDVLHSQKYHSSWTQEWDYDKLQSFDKEYTCSWSQCLSQNWLENILSNIKFEENIQDAPPEKENIPGKTFKFNDLY